MTDTPFSVDALDRLLDGFSFPKEFTFGVSSSGYQVEGGFNGPHDPKNNWYWAELRGEKERTGDCARFLDKYEEDLDRAAWMRLQSCRLGIEWARLQPGVDPQLATPQPFDRDAACRYAAIMAAVFQRQMFPLVTLYHWTHPLWFGPDLWLDWPRAKESFGAYVEFAVTEINRALVEEHRQPPIPYYTTMNEPINVPMVAYVLGIFPRGPAKGLRTALTCLENILRGHLLAYRTIHRIYRERGWPRPTVTMNSWCSASYSMDKLHHDVLLARQNGVARDGVAAYLADQRQRFISRWRPIPYLRAPRFFKRGLDRLMDHAIWRRLRPEPFAALTADLFEGDDPRALDTLSFDLYDAFMGNNVDFEWPRLVHVRNRPDDWNFNPAALQPAVESYSWTARDVPIHMLEQGICHRVVGDRVFPHPNGICRDQAIKRIMAEIIGSLRNGSPLSAWYYWSLVDNYEWGSFEPRFGVFGLDYARGARRLNTDIAGVNAAGAFRLFVEAFRARDVNLLHEAFRAQTYPVYDR